MNKRVLVVSLILNIMFIVAILIGIRYHRKMAFRMVADFTMAEVRLQEHYLVELESGDQKRIESVKRMMNLNIKNGKKAAETWKCAAK